MYIHTYACIHTNIHKYYMDGKTSLQIKIILTLFGVLSLTTMEHGQSFMTFHPNVLKLLSESSAAIAIFVYTFTIA